MAARALGLAFLVGASALLTVAALDAGQPNVVLRTSLSDDIPTLIVMYGPDGVRVHLQGGLVPIDGTAQPRSPGVSQVWLLRTNGSAVKQRSTKESSFRRRASRPACGGRTRDRRLSRGQRPPLDTTATTPLTVVGACPTRRTPHGVQPVDARENLLMKSPFARELGCQAHVLDEGRLRGPAVRHQQGVPNQEEML